MPLRTSGDRYQMSVVTTEVVRLNLPIPFVLRRSGAVGHGHRSTITPVPGISLSLYFHFLVFSLGGVHFYINSDHIRLVI